jgi:hypothetical protein
MPRASSSTRGWCLRRMVNLSGKIGQQVSFQHMPVETEGLAGRVIDSDKIDHPTGTDGLTPQNGES